MNLSVGYDDLSPGHDNSKIFKNITFEVNKDDCILNRGKNGSGKSTLLKILAGQNHHYTGTLEIAKGARISYLPKKHPT